MRNCSRFSIVFFLPLLLCSAFANCQGKPAIKEPDESTAAAASGTSPLKALREQFRPTYDAARSRVESSLSPIVVARFSDLYLVRDRVIIAEGKGIPNKYHLLHQTAHVPLVVFLKLEPHFDTPLSQEAASDLASYRGLIERAVPDLINHGFSEQEVAWQKHVLINAIAFLTPTRPGYAFTRAAFAQFRASVHRAMMDLADVAGGAQVDATHAVMTGWRQQLSDEEWRRLRVIIIGPRQPRHDYASTVYFAALFPERSNSLFPGESRRVFYVESLNIDRRDRSFARERAAVATILLDGQASETIFNNPYRMSIDVMADGARRRVAELDFSLLR